MSFQNERLIALRKEKGYKQIGLAKDLNLSRSTVAMWEAGRSEPTAEFVAKIADLLGCSVGYLMGTEDEINAQRSLDALRADFQAHTEGKLDAMLDQPNLPSNLRPISALHRQNVPLIGKVAAGQPIMAETDYETFVAAPVDCDAALEIEGESMIPTYLPGDIIYIKHQPHVRDGQVAVVLLDDSATLKHVYRDKDGLTLLSDNRDYPPIRVTDADYNYVAIYGVPVGYTRIYKPSIEGKIRKGFKQEDRK